MRPLGVLPGRFGMTLVLVESAQAQRQCYKCVEQPPPAYSSCETVCGSPIWHQCTPNRLGVGSCCVGSPCELTVPGQVTAGGTIELSTGLRETTRNPNWRVVPALPVDPPLVYAATGRMNTATSQREEYKQTNCRGEVAARRIDQKRADNIRGKTTLIRA
jgi:hypothetical protein